MDSIIQFLALSRPFDVPLAGELLDNEIVINFASGRIWSGLEDAIVELGDARDKRIGPTSAFNYSYYEISSEDDFPIILSDPTKVPVGIYRSQTIGIKYVGEDLTIPDNSQLFTHPVEWGSWGYFNENGLFEKSTHLDNSPLKQYYEVGKTIVVNLFTFGPRDKWSGQIIWSDV
jgi:hypothetical protein